MNILFVCTGNTCRSPIAEGILKQNIADLDIGDYNIISRGIHASDGQAASELAVKVSFDNGIDISTHRSKQLTNIEIEDADLILTMSEKHKDIITSLTPEIRDNVFTLGEFSGNNKEVMDPWGMDEAYYAMCFATLKDMIDISMGSILPA